jgi:hypothetical protein
MEKQQSFISAFKEGWNNGPSVRTVKSKLGFAGWIVFAVMSIGRLLVVLATLTLIHILFPRFTGATVAQNAFVIALSLVMPTFLPVYLPTRRPRHAAAMAAYVANQA